MPEAKKLNILVIPDLFPKWEGDVQGIFVLDYLRSVAPYCKVQVFAPKLIGKDAGLVKSEIHGIPITRYSTTDKPVRGIKKFFLYRKLLRKAVKEAAKIPNIDLIHAHGSIVSGTIAAQVAKQKKIPFIVTEHIGPFSVVTNSSWKKRWTKKIIEQANALLCVSEHQKNEILSAGMHPKNVFVTYNPVDTDLFQQGSDSTEKKNILFVGRLDSFKGALRVAEAFKRMSSTHPGWKLTIVGDGEDRPALEEFVKTFHFQEYIHVKGMLTKKQIAMEMQHADFMVFPSRHESFGLVVAEAMSCGLPVIITNRTAPKEFTDPSCGILVDPDNIDEIEKAMRKMMRTHGQYKRKEIRARIVERFSFEKFGKKLLDIYTSLANKR